MAQSTATSPVTSATRATDLFLISFLVMFFELACIRWFAAYVEYLTYFTNWVLLAAFVGMSAGCLAARRPRDFLAYTPLLIALACAAGLGVFVAVRGLKLFWISVGNFHSWEQVYFGADQGSLLASKPLVPIEVIAGFFFLMIGVIFMGLGQVLGKAFNLFESRLQAYALNIGGSLAGIAAFTAASFFQVPALVWFTASFAGLAVFLRRSSRTFNLQASLLFFALIVVGVSDNIGNIGSLAHSWMGGRDYWSPYYRLYYKPQEGYIMVNGIGHQTMMTVDSSPVYSLPYALSREAKRPPIEDVLIVGAGSGNDVAHALRNGAKHIDAVEIDPVIASLGRADHPDKPYADPRVELHINDGRAFLQNTPRKYDLIIYGVVDSLTLHSAYSSVRLESFLFTRQAMETIKSRLKETGVFVSYNYFREGWVVARLKNMLTSVYGAEPLVFGVPWASEIKDTQKTRGFAFLMAGNVDAVRKRFDKPGGYTMESEPGEPMRIGRYREGSGGDEGLRFGPSAVVATQTDREPDDDWPFFYLRKAAIPNHNLAGLALIIVLSLAVLGLASPSRILTIRPHFFLLGSGFMLLETQGVTRMAVLFGSTWQTNSVIFFAILLMSLAGNLFVLKVKPKDLLLPYVALLATLALNLVVPLSWFLSDSVPLRLTKSCLLMFSPIFFAGIVFATSFSRSKDPDVDFGSNIAGAVLGGVLEYLSLVIGFRGLGYLSVVLYALSWASL